jgi:protein-disulfide isomerase
LNGFWGQVNWSRSAARTAICIYEQSSEGFWRFSDFLFRHQTEISIDNLPSKVAEFVKSSPGLRQEKFGQCEASETPDHVLLEDENSGFANGVKATPTFFVNGTKKVGVGDSESEFMTALDAIEARAAANMPHDRAERPMDQ